MQLDSRVRGNDKRLEANDKRLQTKVDKAALEASPLAPLLKEGGKLPASCIEDAPAQKIEQAIRENHALRGELEHTQQDLETLRNLVLQHHPEEEDEPAEVSALPSVQRIAAGPLLNMADFDPTETTAVAGRFSAERYCVAEVRGSSMRLAGIQDGDTVILEKMNVPIDCAIMLCYYSGATTLKLLCKVDDGHWELRYRDGTRRRIVPQKGEEWHVLGRFVQVARVLA